MAKKVLIPNPLAVATIKTFIFPMWKKMVPDRRKYAEQIYAQYRPKGEKELARLNAAYSKGGLDGLMRTLKDRGYTWSKEKVDTVAAPWLICASCVCGLQDLYGDTLNSDCDDAMVLVQSITGGKMWLGCQFNKKGQPENYADWHWELELPEGTVVSNFRVVDGTVELCFLRYSSRFNLIVEACNDFSEVGEIRAIR